MEYTVPGILQVRILEWVAFPFNTGSSQPRDRAQVSRIAGGFFTRKAQEYWSAQPIPSPVDLPDPGIELGSPALQVDSLPMSHQGSPFGPERGLLSLNFTVSFPQICQPGIALQSSGFWFGDEDREEGTARHLNVGEGSKLPFHISMILPNNIHENRSSYTDQELGNPSKDAMDTLEKQTRVLQLVF